MKDWRGKLKRPNDNRAILRSVYSATLWRSKGQFIPKSENMQVVSSLIYSSRIAGGGWGPSWSNGRSAPRAAIALQPLHTHDEDH